MLISEIEALQAAIKKEHLTGAAAGALLGLLLRWFHMLRSVAAVLIIALFIWRALLAEQRRLSPLWLSCLAVLLSVYLLTGPWASARVERMAGEPPASIPGYSVLVGLNQASGGCWNSEDSQLLALYSEKPGSTAREVQRAMLKKARERAASGEIDYPALFKAKLGVFLSRDDVCVSYCAAGLTHFIRYQLLCNTFWYFSLLLAMGGGIRMWREKERSCWLLAPLYVLGLTLAQLLVEVAGRYHYSLIPMLLIIGVQRFFLSENRDKGKGLMKE